MTLLLLRRGITFTSLVNSHFLSRVRNICSKASTMLDNDNEASQSLSVDNARVTAANYCSRTHLWPLLSDCRAHSDGYKIELVDPDTWRVSSGLAHAWRGTDRALETRTLVTGAVDEAGNYSPLVEDDLNFDEIEDMRIRGNLFYKLDRDSKEFEEYNFDFHRKKSSKNKDGHKESKEENPDRNSAYGSEKSSKNKDGRKESKKKEKPNHNSAFGGEELAKLIKNKCITSSLDEMDSYCVGKKKLRTPTYNQLTGPYHEPFCLDIYISKGSVRACIVHRVTSKVVAVAHSISKDMKFDLASTKDSTACAAVGGVLAQRALADDIHDVVYTPRKGDKLEGKLQIVLQSVIDNGVNVKVKIKQRRANKTGLPYPA